MTEITGEMHLGPKMPGHDNQKENQQILPAKERAKPDPGFAVKDRQQDENESGVEQPKHSFRQAGKRAAKPESREPKLSMFATLIAPQTAVDRAGDERSDHRFRHDDPGQEKRAADSQENQAGDETTPITRQLFGDEEYERSRSDDRERNG
jgi:hypothetical protein